MDFNLRGSHPQSAASPQPSGGDVANNKKKEEGKWFEHGGRAQGKWLRVATVLLLFCIAILMLAIAGSIYFGGSNESGYLNTKLLQAVDVSIGGSSGGDQIYFGNLKTINDKYVVLNNVFYIPSTQQGSNVTLEPLVCQIDKPVNQMVINRSSVNWWENLQSDGQVATSIANYNKAHPNGPTCPTSNSSSSNSSSSNSSTSSTTPATTAPATTTPSTSTKKP